MKILFIIFLFLSFKVNSQLSVELERKQCDKSMMSFTSISRDHISSINIESNQLNLSLGLVANCEMNFIFQAKLSVSKDTLFLEYSNQLRIINEGDPVPIYEEVIAMCDCYFNIDLVIDSVLDLPNTVLILKKTKYIENRADTYEKLYLLDQNGLPTIPKKFPRNSKKYNGLTKNGSKVGIWHIKKDGIGIYSNYVQSNNEETRILWCVGINKSGKYEFIDIYSSDGLVNSISEMELNRIHEKIEFLNNEKKNKP